MTLLCMLASASEQSDLIMAWFMTGNLRGDGRNTREQYSSMVQAWQLRGSKNTRICLIMVVLQTGAKWYFTPCNEGLHYLWTGDSNFEAQNCGRQDNQALP